MTLRDGMLKRNTNYATHVSRNLHRSLLLYRHRRRCQSRLRRVRRRFDDRRHARERDGAFGDERGRTELLGRAVRLWVGVGGRSEWRVGVVRRCCGLGSGLWRK